MWRFNVLRGRSTPGLVGVMALGLAMLVASHDSASAALTPTPPISPQKLPSFATVEAAVNKHFLSIKRTPEDLISQGDVQPVFDQIAKLGWRVADQTEIVQQILPDKSFLVNTLREGEGRTFARRVAQFPDGYDRVERLSKLPHGHNFLQGLIPGPDGWKMIEYMTETPGGQVLGELVENGPRGRQFNDTTGRIYTSGQLVKRLRLSYNQAAGITTVAEPTDTKKKKKVWPRTHVNVVLPD